MSRHPRQLLTIAILLVVAVAASTALAEPRVTGTITATLDGEEHSWQTYADMRSGQVVNTASWIEPFAGASIRSYTLSGHKAPALSLASEGGIMIGIESFGSVGPCPCTFSEATAGPVEISYFTTSSFGRNVYQSIEASVVFDELEQLDELTYRASGSFRGVLAFRESFANRPDPENTLTIEGTFELLEITREPEGE